MPIRAETLADVIEESHTDSQESLKDFIRSENNTLRSDLESQNKELRSDLEAQNKELRNDLKLEITSIRTELDSKITSLHYEVLTEMKEQEVRMAISQKDLLIKLFGIIVGTVGLAVTILKLF